MVPDLYEDTTGPLTNPDVIALVTVMTGLAVAVGGHVAAHATYLRDAGNYAVASSLDEVVGPAGLVVLLFVLGGYLGCGLVWCFSARARDIVPVRVALGAASAGALGFLLVLLVGAFLPLGKPLALGVTVLAAYYGARLTTGLRRAKPPAFGVRLTRVGLIGLMIGLAAFLVSYKPVDFPGPSASAEVRDAWARKTFKDHYPRAAAFVTGCPDVAERVGAVRSVAPVAGVNQVFYTPSEADGDFTLEATGDRGRATLHVSVVKAYPAGHEATWRTAGTVLDGRHAVPLLCP